MFRESTKVSCKSIGLTEEEKNVKKIEVKEKNNDLRNGLIIWTILAVIFIIVLTKGN